MREHAQAAAACVSTVHVIVQLAACAYGMTSSRPIQQDALGMVSAKVGNCQLPAANGAARQWQQHLGPYAGCGCPNASFANSQRISSIRVLPTDVKRAPAKRSDRE